MANKVDENTPEPETVGSAEAAPVVKLTREQIREALFASDQMEPKRVDITIGGQELEWRSPSIQEVQELRDASGERNFIINLLVGWTFVPGTEEKVFSDSDYATLLKMPYKGAWVDTLQKIAASLELNVDTKVKN